jgi:hypothetical protein
LIIDHFSLHFEIDGLHLQFPRRQELARRRIGFLDAISKSLNAMVNEQSSMINEQSCEVFHRRKDCPLVIDH